MEDHAIIDLYWSRSERAIAETHQKYGAYCRAIAFHILEDHGDSEECVNDTWLRAWNTMPPQRPERLSVFLGKITRNLALDRWKHRRAEKRGKGQVPLALEELGECTPAAHRTEAVIERLVLTDLLNAFLGELKPEARKLFVGRYWYLRPVGELAKEYGLSQSKVKMSLLRTREKLRQRLEQEGFLDEQ